MLPRVQQKVLAMFFFENLPLAEIASCLGLSKIATCQMLVETIGLLQRSFLEITSPKSVTEVGKLLPAEQQSDTGNDRVSAGLAAAPPLANSILLKTDLPDRRAGKLVPLGRAETALVLGALGVICVVFWSWAHNSLPDPTKLALRQEVLDLAHPQIRRQSGGPPLDPSRTDHPLATSFPQVAVLQPSQTPASSPSPAVAFNREVNRTAQGAPDQHSVIPGLPGANVSEIERQFLRSRPTSRGESAAPRRFSTGRDAREKRISFHIALIDRRMDSASSGKKELLNMWKRHLERQKNLARDLRRHSIIGLRRQRHEEPRSLFNAIGNSFGLRSRIGE